MSEAQKTQRALLISGVLVLALGAIAFWPSKRWVPPPRPALRAPIVFDELVSQPPPPSLPSVTPSR